VLTDGQKAERDDNARNYENTRRVRLEEAKTAYQEIADELREREKLRPLTPVEGVLGRRAVLGMAECCQDLGYHLDALRLYQGLIEHNRAKIESLVACARMVELKNRLLSIDGLLRPEDRREVIDTVRGVLPLALKDLDAMDDKGPDFQGDNVWNKPRWQQWLTTQLRQLDAPPGPALQNKTDVR
jgi:hypothetical protein